MRRRDPARAVAAGIAFAAALLVGGGLALDLAGVLDATGWVVLALVLLFVIVGASVVLRDPRRRAVPALVATAALGLAIGAVALSRASALDHQRESRFTQLWIVPDGPGRSAELGVRNEEGQRAAFRVQVYPPASRGGPSLVDDTIVLGPGRTWSRRVAIPATPLPERISVEVFRAGATEPYRSAHIWTPPGR